MKTRIVALAEAALHSALIALTAYYFFLPGLSVLRDLTDPALARPGVPKRAVDLHRSLTPRIEHWARERIASGRASSVPLYDVPATEWPLFTAVFYLMATEQLEQQIPDASERPMTYAASAVSAARDLLIDPSHHSWVKTHWGEDYLHRQNFFFRSLLIAGLTSHEALTHDGSSLPMLRDQVETLSASLDASRLGLMNDYPEECYPIDVLAGIGFIRRADAVLGTDHSAFAARALRAFEGSMTDDLGLVRFRVDLPDADEVQPARGIGMSWSLIFAPDLWPERSREWYATYEHHFWQDRTWAAGWREFRRGTWPEWTFEVDAGPVADGFGTAANAFGIAAARRNGRFDHAYTLSTQLVATAWPLPDGTLLSPRTVSQAADAPYLGESGILYFLTVPPKEGVAIVTGGSRPWLVWLSLATYFAISFAMVFAVGKRIPSLRRRLCFDAASSAGAEHHQ
ncbi:MAG: hypothetical protein R3B13_20490 [Polyangiaceae bacterium]